MKKIIVLLLLTGGYFASAKEPGATAYKHPKPFASIAPGRHGDDGGGSVHFFYDIDLGYAGMSATGANAFNQGAFMYGGDLGVKIDLRSGYIDVANQIGVSIGGYQANLHAFHSSTVRGLISYTHFWRFRNGANAGFFWQAGLAPTYLYTVTDKDQKDISAQVNRLFVEPMIYVGFHNRVVFVNRETGNELGSARAFIGPYFSYGIGNLSKQSGTTIHPGYKIGLQWTYVF